MEQTVTLIKSDNRDHRLFSDEFPRMEAHVQAMTDDGWALVTVHGLQNRTDTPVMLFWRRG